MIQNIMDIGVKTQESLQGHIALPACTALCVQPQGSCVLTTDGEIKTLSHSQAGPMINGKPVLLCHAPYVAAQINWPVPLTGVYDVLELFAFVHPARFAVPTIPGLCKVLGLPPPPDFESQTVSLLEITRALLSDLKKDPWQAKANPLKIAAVMGQMGKRWAWTHFIFEALGETYDPRIPVISKTDLNVWKNLPDWAEEAPRPAAASNPIHADEAERKLLSLLGAGSEKRSQQVSYTRFLSEAFSPLKEENSPQVVIAEAGTGVGKTLGYLAPAAVWSAQNKGSVWISTYTKNLQRQVNQELTRLFPDDTVKDSKVTIRKGRENYVCLMNYEEAAMGAALSTNPRQAIALGIMARWIAATKDGDLLSGEDFPGWLSGLLGYQYSIGLSDRRGECIYSACDHYHRCFVEKSVRRSAHADIVVANHALVMIQTATQTNPQDLPTRYVFDEGHHLFDAADSAFAAHLTAQETYDLRRWIRGNEGGSKSRLRGLKARAQDVIAGQDKMEKALEDIIEHARLLTAEAWKDRIKDKNPKGACESFILAVYDQVRIRAQGKNAPYSLETDTFPITPEIGMTIAPLIDGFRKLQKPMLALADLLRKHVTDYADTLESDTKKRMEALQSGLERRARLTLQAWIDMLLHLQTGRPHPDFIDWMEIERIDGKAVDIGLYRHWVNPMIPMSACLKPSAHGIVITSATLRDKAGSSEWDTARQMTGSHLISPLVQESHFSSPFDYAERTKIFVVNDLPKHDLDQMTKAYEALFRASQGGAIGLFTAISRLKHVYEGIKIPLGLNDIPLYAQHMDGMDTGTLIDIFRDDEKACLLGTDAVRDGVDVPGRSLRLLVFDRVPWPRPSIMHRARRDAFGAKDYDDRLTRMKLKQAYGRLIRRADDKGVFVMLDSMMPSRLTDAFPDGVAIERMGLKDVIQKTKEFLTC